ncbi:hypothetical protein [Alteraurantiacibacter aquimixticola]|uniref:TonB C-terminal domain-containing protein n=1 Tax=Alteraurantiacibacter aquimixticola TaxID=2489173 RepID=A0A4V4U8R1_9SPHN|nr:hypothetical protein [Alteraurantiacibacter aquimixticola]TIX51057.1 hypothetical protein E5222_00795 [Alteraurantiacibacter aquimixticola]
MIRLALLATALALPLPVAAQAANRMIEPVGQWEIDSDDESCTLVRSFTALEPGDTTMFIRSWGPFTAFRVSVAGPTMQRDDSRAIFARASFGEPEEAKDIVAIGSSYRSGPMVAFQGRVDDTRNGAGTNAFGSFIYHLPERPDVNIAVPFTWEATQLYFDGSAMAPQTLRLDAMETARTLMEDCERDLMSEWEFGPPDQTGFARAPVLENPQVVGERMRFPDNVIVNHSSRIVQMRFHVGADGEVLDCEIQYPNWSNGNRRRSCREISDTAEFTPALDATGAPIDSLYRATLFLIRFD